MLHFHLGKATATVIIPGSILQIKKEDVEVEVEDLIEVFSDDNQNTYTYSTSKRKMPSPNIDRSGRLPPKRPLTDVDSWKQKQTKESCNYRLSSDEEWVYDDDTNSKKKPFARQKAYNDDHDDDEYEPPLKDEKKKSSKGMFERLISMRCIIVH